jgi:segregation and condensation protein A
MAATLAEIKSRMLLPRAAPQGDGLEEDPRAELVRRLQEYERFKQAALNLDLIPRLERDTWVASADFNDRRVVRVLPDVTLRELLLAFKDVATRSEMFAHHHIQREPLSVRARMSDILANLKGNEFVPFSRLFLPEEGRMGVAVTFISILELLREGLLEIVQNEPYSPIHICAADPERRARRVIDSTAEEASAADARLLAETQAAADAAEAAAAAEEESNPEDDMLPGEPAQTGPTP